MNAKVTTSFCIACLLLVGCPSPRVNVVDPNSTPGSKTGPLITQSIDLQDLIGTAEKMIESLRVSGVLEKGRQQPVLIGISPIENRTSVRDFSVDLLRNPIITALSRDGKVKAEAEDPQAREARRKQALVTGQPPRDPDLYLFGNIQEIYRRVDQKRQNSYIFHLALADNSGATIWQEDQNIIKLSERPRIGR